LSGNVHFGLEAATEYTPNFVRIVAYFKINLR
jgi:hypothetical protein